VENALGHGHTSNVMNTTASNPQSKPFLSLMNELKGKTGIDLREELCRIFDSQKPTGIPCPVPGCTHTKSFVSWGELYDHFLDGGHKRDFFNLYRERYHRPYSPASGLEFKYGVMALMLAQIMQPTSVDDASKVIRTRKPKPKKTTAELIEGIPQRPKRVKRTEVQVSLPGLQEASEGTVGEKAEHGPAEIPVVVESTSASVAVLPHRNTGAFHKVAEFIRNSDEINLVWRGKVLEMYIEMFHGIPPCFHCRSAEGKQIHHQNPLFHEIVLLMLSKLGTTAEKVWEAKEQGNEIPLQTVLKEVTAYHMKEGRVLAVPYCSDCNQDAELKRRTRKKKGC